jgi:lysozyme family protein/peptidoglycan hydrolase-like protein with peptidoglycan-binding domain
MKDDYQLLFDSCLIRPERLATVNALAAKIVAGKRRYQRVAEPLGIPWYVVGLIHAMESSLDFSTHLHNGDPLTARTTRWPPGRPAKGEPPFTWEDSATDALTNQGLPKWQDWSGPGVLYQLEAYNGWGYRNQKPPSRTPYLWSFSNHYTRGKYVADGKYSPTAVSQQCGAAVILKRLAQMGVLEMTPAKPRPLQLANPHMTGPDVEAAQQLLASNPYGDFAPGTADGEYGPVTADAVRRAKFALGFPDARVNGTFGPVIQSFLDGSKPLPKSNGQLRAKRLAAQAAEGPIRAEIVKWALWGVQNNALISYSQGPSRLAALGGAPGTLPLATDCSAFSTLCYSWAKAPNPNYQGPYDREAGGYTGTMLRNCRRIPQSAAKPGDLVVWTPPSDGQHVVILVSEGANPWLVSHGSDSGPKKLRFADEDAYQRRNGHGTAVFLSVF